MRKLRVTFDTTDKRLPTIVELLVGETANFNVTEVTNSEPPTAKAPRKVGPRGKNAPNVLDREKPKVILKFLREHGYSCRSGDPKLKRALKDAGYHSGASSPLHDMKTAGAVTYAGGVYTLVEKYRNP